MGYQKSILFAEMGKWYDKKVIQSRVVNVDCIIATSIPKLGFIGKKIGKKLISTDYGRYGSQYSPKKSKEG